MQIEPRGWQIRTLGLADQANLAAASFFSSWICISEHGGDSMLLLRSQKCKV